jgi:hypothetical protein
MLSPSPTRDLAVAWLEALWKEATHGPVRTPSKIPGKDRTGRLTQLRGKIDRVCQASSAFLWDLYGRIEGRAQITTDGLHHYTASILSARNS